MNRRERSMQNDSYPRSRRTPSFSSSLLDAIYRSTDQSNSDLDEHSRLGHFNEVHYKKQSNVSHYSETSLTHEYGKFKDMNLPHWMEKQSSHSSSECSSGSGGFFSSSETEMSYKHRLRPKFNKSVNSGKQKKQKVKQPMSPGSRIASFLSSIFNYGSVKKAKMCYAGASEDGDFEQKSQSPCVSSSASSYSRRSCMSKTPSSAKKNNNGVKRSVRFYPVSIILGEDSHKFVYENDPDIMSLPSGVGKITRSSSTKEEKQNTNKKQNNNSVMAIGNGSRNCRVMYKHNGDEEEEEEEEEDDDALSCSSSDLFELDHIIGSGKGYQEELPVYETTSLDTNKAIANGLRL